MDSLTSEEAEAEEVSEAEAAKLDPLLASAATEIPNTDKPDSSSSGEEDKGSEISGSTHETRWRKLFRLKVPVASKHEMLQALKHWLKETLTASAYASAERAKNSRSMSKDQTANDISKSNLQIDSADSGPTEAVPPVNISERDVHLAVRLQTGAQIDLVPHKLKAQTAYFENLRGKVGVRQKAAKAPNPDGKLASDGPKRKRGRPRKRRPPGRAVQAEPSSSPSLVDDSLLPSDQDSSQESSSSAKRRKID